MGLGLAAIYAEGVEAEMELPFAALQQLCAPLLGALDRLPPPQGDALQATFGLSSGSRPDRHAQNAREDGVLSVLPATLNYLASLRIFQGDLEAAAMLLDESDSISRSTTGHPGDVMRLLLSSYRGDGTQTSRLSGMVQAARGRGGLGRLH